MGSGASLPSEPKLRRVAYIRLFNTAREKEITISGLCEQAFAAHDSNGDGYLTKGEFVRAAFESGFVSNSDQIEAIFDRLLENSSSQLSVEQLVGFLLPGRSWTRQFGTTPNNRPVLKKRRRPSIVGVLQDDGQEKVLAEVILQPSVQSRRLSVTKKRPSVVGIVNNDGREEIREVRDVSYSASQQVTGDPTLTGDGNDDFRRILGVNRIQNLRRCSLLGLGMFGTVKLVQDATTGQHCLLAMQL